MPTNRLEKELSPYLLQHKDNPVDWYPWGEEAFEKAKREDKPVFLSIGYATCHWCHVMEHESFEDELVAGLMNDAFVSVKVDREERPDIDQVYMSYCQLTAGHGGWPLTIIMTPDKEPFFAATYLPRQSRYGRIGMMDLVPRVQQLWKDQKEKVIQSAAQNVEAIVGMGEWEADAAGPATGVLDFAFQQLADRYDPEYGGFGDAPKFPSPHQLQFLARYGNRTGSEDSLEMASHTLKMMRLGGIFDHVGFGFHRYATDRVWLVPHFEKMLYDQATMVLAALDVFQLTKDGALQEIVEKTLVYVMRDMRHEEGGFFSAEDADSEGVEGKFYVWSVAEVKEILDTPAAARFINVFNLKPEGNFLEEATGALTGENIPHLQSSLVEIAREREEGFEELSQNLEHARQRLFDIREKRIHPLKDDKVLTDWNGLMIAAMARAGEVLNNQGYIEAAVSAVAFVNKYLVQADGRLLHRFRNGRAGLQANLDDYAFFVYGLLALYRTTFDVAYLKQAIQLTDQMIQHFWDDTQGGFYFTPNDGEQLIARQKEAYDGAIPSGNSMALMNLLLIGRITGEPSYEERADTLLQAFGSPINRHPSGFTAMLAGVDFVSGASQEIVIVGEKNHPDTDALVDVIRNSYLPNSVVLHKNDETETDLAAIAPYTVSMTALNGKSAVYVCENYQCNRPVADVDALWELLKPSNGAEH